MAIRERRLRGLTSIGPATLRDFELLGVNTVDELAMQDPRLLYEELCRITGVRQDICCLDVFRAAVAQARNPLLPPEQRRWWYWSRLRKANNGDKNGGGKSGGKNGDE